MTHRSAGVPAVALTHDTKCKFSLVGRGGEGGGGRLSLELTVLGAQVAVARQLGTPCVNSQQESARNLHENLHSQRDCLV